MTSHYINNKVSQCSSSSVDSSVSYEDASLYKTHSLPTTGNNKIVSSGDFFVSPQESKHEKVTVTTEFSSKRDKVRSLNKRISSWTK